jgi:hypothetical protein
LDQNGTSRLMRRVRYQSTLYIKGEEWVIWKLFPIKLNYLFAYFFLWKVKCLIIKCLSFSVLMVLVLTTFWKQKMSWGFILA